MAYLIVSLGYVVSRALLARAGLPYGFELDWMWLADPADLRDRLAQTLWFFHAFPPGMDLLTGILLKTSGEQAARVGVQVVADVLQAVGGGRGGTRVVLLALRGILLVGRGVALLCR